MRKTTGIFGNTKSSALNNALKKHITVELIEGNIKAFEGIFNHYYKSLLYFAISYVKNKDDATDIVQSIFLKLWERRASLDSNTDITAYLFTLTKNSCLNYLNHSKAQTNYLHSEDQKWRELQLNYYALENFNVTNLVYEELEVTLRNTINSMPQESARIFTMSRFEGLKYAEIAEKLNISVKTVEKKMSIALAQLREAFKKFYLLLFFF